LAFGGLGHDAHAHPSFVTLKVPLSRMARADDPTQLLDESTPTPQRRRWLGVSWPGFLGLLLAVALLTVALLQARQYSVLKAALQTGHDYGALTLFESESDYLRLLDKWRAVSEGSEAREARPGADAQALKEQYELWVDRVGLLHGERARALFDDNMDYRRALAQMDAFITAADRALGQQPVAQPNAAFLLNLLPALQALDEPVHAIALGASHRLALQLDKRAELARSQNQLGLGLTVFLSVLTLGFAAMALRQVSKFRQRRVALEEATQKLHQARAQAEANSDAKSSFLANMSHEIRTPFHGLMGMLSLLRETGLSPRQIDYLRTATESADHLLAVLNDILDMSQLESGRMSLSLAPVELRGLLRDVEALMRPQAMGKSLALHIDADPGVPERVLLDGTRVKQILFNLLSNAIKFSDRGAVVLDLRWHDSGHKKSAPTLAASSLSGMPELEFVVTDTGPGIHAATLDKLFNRFTQGDKSPSRRHEGTGLGLEISRNLARLMNGDITVRSAVGKGSCFALRIPVQALSAAQAQQLPRVSPRIMPTRALQVLVAEDHPVNRQYMAALLEGLGHEPHFAANGEEAVRAASSRPFDLVLMDLHMPVLDGLGATRAIRCLPDPSISTLPIVALTADALDETRERCLVAGMNDFLTKPVSPQKLATSLRRLFGSATCAEALPQSAQAEPSTPAASAASGTQALVDEAAVAMSLQAMSLEKMGEMMEIFLAQGPETVQRLRAAVRDAQPLELRVNAHAAKGAALNLGLSGLAATAEALQQGASHLPAHEIARLVQRYEEQLGATRRVLRDLGLIGVRPALRSVPAPSSAGASGARSSAQPVLRR
jgi:two-component system, sensor histidine kinase